MDWPLLIHVCAMPGCRTAYVDGATSCPAHRTPLILVWVKPAEPADFPNSVRTGMLRDEPVSEPPAYPAAAPSARPEDRPQGPPESGKPTTPHSTNVDHSE